MPITQLSKIRSLSTAEFLIKENRIALAELEDKFKDEETGRWVNKAARLEALSLEIDLKHLEERRAYLLRTKENARLNRLVARKEVEIAKAKAPSKEDIAMKLMSLAVQTANRDSNRRANAAERREQNKVSAPNYRVLPEPSVNSSVKELDDIIGVRSIMEKDGFDMKTATQIWMKMKEASGEFDKDAPQLNLISGSTNLSEVTPAEIVPQVSGFEALEQQATYIEPEIKEFKLPTLNIGGPDSDDSNSNNSRISNNQPDVKTKPKRPLTREERIEAEALATAEARRSLGLEVEADNSDGLGA